MSNQYDVINGVRTLTDLGFEEDKDRRKELDRSFQIQKNAKIWRKKVGERGKFDATFGNISEDCDLIAVFRYKNNLWDLFAYDSSDVHDPEACDYMLSHEVSMLTPTTIQRFFETFLYNAVEIRVIKKAEKEARRAKRNAKSKK